MATYGEIRLRLAKAFPSLDPELIVGWIQDRYQLILSELQWSRMEVSAVLQTAAPYEEGTVDVTEGSTAITGTGTTWTAAMTGRKIRINSQSAYYTFTRVSDTSGTLDRPYEGDDDTELEYSIWQNVYTLPADCRLLDEDAFVDLEGGPLTRLNRQQLDESAPGRVTMDTPSCWASYPDDSSTPPRMQVELYPVPNEARGIPYTYTAEEDALSGTGATILPWVQPRALIEGVTADCKRHLKDYAGAREHETLYDKALSKMKEVEAGRRGPTRLQIDNHYSDHRLARANR